MEWLERLLNKGKKIYRSDEEAEIDAQMKHLMRVEGVALEAGGQNMLDGSDAGPIQLEILTSGSFVIIESSRAVKWTNLPPELAIDLARELDKWARHLINEQTSEEEKAKAKEDVGELF